MPYRVQESGGGTDLTFCFRLSSGIPKKTQNRVKNALNLHCAVVGTLNQGFKSWLIKTFSGSLFKVIKKAVAVYSERYFIYGLLVVWN